MAEELTEIWAKVALFLQPTRNPAILTFPVSLLALIAWQFFPEPLVVLDVIVLVLFWSGYLIMIQVAYGEGLQIGAWMYKGLEETAAKGPGMQFWFGVSLFFTGLMLAFLTVTSIFHPAF